MEEEGRRPGSRGAVRANKGGSGEVQDKHTKGGQMGTAATLPAIVAARVSLLPPRRLREGHEGGTGTRGCSRDTETKSNEENMKEKAENRTETGIVAMKGTRESNRNTEKKRKKGFNRDRN